MQCLPFPRRRPRWAVLAVVGALVVGVSAGAPAADQSHDKDAAATEREQPGGLQVAGVPPAGVPPAGVPPAGVQSPDPDRVAVMPPTHVVDPGETLGQVAQRYGMGTDELVRANAVRDRNLVRPGRTLVLPRTGAQAPATPEEAMAANLPLERLMDDVAARFGWNPATVKAVAWRESRWNQRVLSHKGAIGVMQVRPGTGQVVAEHLGRELDLYDVEHNLVAGVAYLDLLHQQHGGHLPAILASYHQGPTSVARQGRLAITQDYIAEVLELRERFAR